MTTIALSALAGLICGIVFSAVRLPIPAPITLAGVIGVISIWAGYVITERVINDFF